MTSPDLHDQILAEVESRKIQKLTDDGTISLEDMANAEIVLVCECGTEQDVDNDVCIGCGRCLS